jgi:L-threonylcarbamoyladenylate synthase
MKTRVIHVDRDRPDAAAIEEAAAALREGKLVVFPTETVYGLGAHALDPNAVQKIFDAKERPANDPLIVHIAHIGQVNQCAAGMPAGARKLALSFWAGPLTLVLPKRSEVPDLVTAGLPSVALRVPSHRVARALMETAGIPIAAPSANRFSRPSPDDGGACDRGPRWASRPDPRRGPHGHRTRIDDRRLHDRSAGAEAARRHYVRAGPVPRARGHRANGERGVDEPQPAPGQMTRHYAPRAELTLYEGAVDAVRRRIAADVRSMTAAGDRVGILAPEEDLSALAPELAGRAASGRVETLPYGSRDDLERSGRELYASIRALDSSGVAKILAVGVGAEGLARAIHDRLLRAADGRVRTIVQE